MKLYYLKGACSLASYISLIEAGQKFEGIEVDRGTRKGTDGTELKSLNPRGYVPVLVLDDGSVLTENVAVLSYISTLDASGKLAPKPGTMGFFRVVEWLAFIATEIHKGFSPLWYPDTPAQVREQTIAKLGKRFDVVVAALGNREYLYGNAFTIADAYLFTILSWSKLLKVDLARWPALTAYVERIGTRPSVQQAKRAESGGVKQ